VEYILSRKRAAGGVADLTDDALHCPRANKSREMEVVDDITDDALLYISPERKQEESYKYY
jgi:hypothetical protein